MKIVTKIEEIKKITCQVKKQGKAIGFVPTMGALHLGHLSLAKAAKKETDFVIVSIFVNPTQFGKNEDYRKYPRNIKQDAELIKKEKADLIFLPDVKCMYPDDFSVYINEDNLSHDLCGKSRPGHFRGVCTVVAKLFNIVNPDVAYFGQKDYQQVQVIKRMVRDLNFSVKIKTMPIIRERDGLAMSSRNAYLASDERKEAICLYNSLEVARKMVSDGIVDVDKIIEAMKKVIISCKYARIDYINITDVYSLKPIKKIQGQALLVLAVYIGKTRLIDNIIVRTDTRR